jgi:hypothetical protein
MIVLKTLELGGFFSVAHTRDLSTHQPGNSMPDEDWHIGSVAEGVMGSVFAFTGPLNDDHITEIQKNNRSARADLKRQANTQYLAQEIKNAQEANEQKAIEGTGYLDAYEDAYKDTEHYVRGNARVSMHTPRGRA